MNNYCLTTIDEKSHLSPFEKGGFRGIWIFRVSAKKKADPRACLYPQRNPKN